MANRKQGPDRRPAEQIKKEIADELRQGASLTDALEVVGRSTSWYHDQRSRDPDFAHLIDRIRVHASTPENRNLQVPDFPEFCERFLYMRLWPHQLNMFDVLEGREPRWLPDGIIYSPGSMGHRRVLINVPPNHAKTMSVSIAYVLWRILRDPSMTVLVISKTQGFAAKILWGIKQRLTHPRYADLQLAFGPVGGFKETADQWTNTQVYLWGDQRDSQDKDPTLEAVGMGGQIYGNRAKLVLVDDAIVLSNAAAWQGQQDWIRQEVASRIGPDDQIAVVGTRVAPVDLYRELLNPDHYADGEVPWTHLGMPAVLEYGESPADWVTLWPVSDLPFAEADVADEEGLFPRWTGQRLARVRNEVGPKRWSLVYMQQGVNEETVFSPTCVKGAQDGRRSAGMMPVPGVTGGCEPGARLVTIIGVDPAVVGNSAFCVYTLDPRTGQRWVIDMKVLKGPTPTQIREMLERLVDQFKASEVIVEANAFQRYMVQDPTVKKMLASRGVVMKPHYTHSHNKQDPEYGVASMSPLLGTEAIIEHRPTHQKDNLVSFPGATSPGMKMFLDELISWDPTLAVRKRQQDTVMAWWVAETRARELMVPEGGRRGFQPRSGFLSANDQAKRFTVRLSDAAEYARSSQDVYM
jgi:hypothetical protein